MQHYIVFLLPPFFTNYLISSFIPFLAIYKQEGVLKGFRFSSVFSKRCPKAILSSKLKSIMWNCCGWVAYFSQSSKSFNSNEISNFTSLHHHHRPLQWPVHCITTVSIVFDSLCLYFCGTKKKKRITITLFNNWFFFQIQKVTKGKK